MSISAHYWTCDDREQTMRLAKSPLWRQRACYHLQSVQKCNVWGSLNPNTIKPSCATKAYVFKEDNGGLVLLLYNRQSQIFRIQFFWGPLFFHLLGFVAALFFDKLLFGFLAFWLKFIPSMLSLRLYLKKIYSLAVKYYRFNLHCSKDKTIAVNTVKTDN